MNPLTEEPSAAAVRTVKRFGLVGLIVVAVCAAIRRRLFGTTVEIQEEGITR